MFSVPYDRNIFDNWYAVGIFHRSTECNRNLYDIMYKGSPGPRRTTPARPQWKTWFTGAALWRSTTPLDASPSLSHGCSMESGCCEGAAAPDDQPPLRGQRSLQQEPRRGTGAVGVLTYNLFNYNANDYSHVLAVMFSVPYDRNLYSNWYAVGIFHRGTECDHDLYEAMYNGSEERFARAKADGLQRVVPGATLVVVSATMSDSGRL
ncbi:hypothetical protein CRUP_031383 [Coryphaenoides rupestris]|nr:hypothetical protein CRUP_031383 [Coryphaenoides rupestris]